MRKILFVSALCLFVLSPLVEAYAGPPGRGGGMGGLGNPGGSFGAASQGFGGSSVGGSPSSGWDFGARSQSRFGYERGVTSFESTPRNGLRTEQQRLNEERNFNHRLGQAERLRQNSINNGNERLSWTADRMEQSAQQQFTDRNQRTESFQNRAAVEDGNPYMPNRAWGGTSAERIDPPASPQQPASAGLGVERQRYKEAGNWNHRLNQAERLGQPSESDGNRWSVEAANRVQERTQQQFADRDQRVDSYQNRVSAQNGHQYVPRYPPAPHSQTIPASPSSPAKKPSILDRMRSLWPFK